MKRIIILSAPSGTGKSSVISALQTIFPNISFSISATTRPPRKGEVDGQDYHFISREKFCEDLNNNKFIDHCKGHTGHLYGTYWSALHTQTTGNQWLLLDVNFEGFHAMKPAALAEGFEVIDLLLLPPSLQELQNRLIGRNTESLSHIQERLDFVHKDISHHDLYTYVVVNDVLEQCVQRCCTILKQHPNIDPSRFDLCAHEHANALLHEHTQKNIR
ncbi:MAG: guanylate kinase [Alphaproteobacteria bacterium]|nr:guanylate kinase [Alphaproteobacteria bacterium]